MPASPDPKTLHDARMAVSDGLGFVFEGFGLPRAAGRMLGWLTVCEQADQSAVEIAEVLHLAPSTVSTMSRLLLKWGFAERSTRRGDRKRYLRARPNGWLNAIYHEVEAWKSVKPQLGALRELLKDAPLESREGVDELHDFIHFIEREMPALFERFLAEQQARLAKEKK